MKKNIRSSLEVLFDSFEAGEPEAENNMNKKKISKVAPYLKTNGDGVIVWRNKVSKTSAGPCQRALHGMKDAQVA